MKNNIYIMLAMLSIFSLSFAGNAKSQAMINPYGERFIKSESSGMYLNTKPSLLNGGSSINIIEIGKSVESHVWDVRPATQGYVYIRSASGGYLDVDGGSKVDGTAVHLAPFNGGDTQKWWLVPDGNGNFSVQSKLGPFIDVKKSGLVQMWSALPWSVQQWKFESAKKRTPVTAKVGSGEARNATM